MSDTVPVREIWYIYRGHWLNRGILAATFLLNIGTEPVSHCELWEPQHRDGEDEFEVEYISKGLFLGHCWTSTTRDTDNGTVVRPAFEVLNHPERWYYTEHRVRLVDFEVARNCARGRVTRNKGYSWRDLTRFIMPLWLLKLTGIADNGKEICSEHVAQWLVDMSVLPKNTIPSPRRLCKQTVLATGSPLRRLIDDKIVRDGKWKKS